MELAKWMEAWRHGGQGAPSELAEPPAPLAAVYTNAAATLRLILNALPAGAGTQQAVAEAPRLVHLCGEVEACGAALGIAHIEHAAGQMRSLWQSVHNKTLVLEAQVLPAMRACVSYLLHRLTQRQPFPKEPTEILQWNAIYQQAMAGVQPSMSRSEPVRDFRPVRAGRSRPTAQPRKTTTPVYQWVRVRRFAIQLSPPEAGALDAAELERLLLLSAAS